MAGLAAAMKLGKERISTRAAISILNGVKAAAIGRLEQEASRLSPAGHACALAYLDDLLSAFSELFVPKKSD